MSLQESLVADASARFPSLNAAPLVDGLLTRIRNGAGGVTGFINELRAQGLSDTVAGWKERKGVSADKPTGRCFTNPSNLSCSTTSAPAGRRAPRLAMTGFGSRSKRH